MTDRKANRDYYRARQRCVKGGETERGTDSHFPVH